MTERNTTREGTNTPADKVNETAAPQDIVTPRAFEGRVRRNNGSSPIPPKRGNRNEDETQCEQIEPNTPAIDHHNLTENKRLQEMDDEEEARAECYRLAQ
jgi:hypothetical protein